MAATQNIDAYTIVPSPRELPPYHDPEKADGQIYGTFQANKSESGSCKTVVAPRGLVGRVWLSFSTALVVVGTMAVFAFVVTTILL